MLIKNVLIFSVDKTFKEGSIWTRQGKIKQIFWGVMPAGIEAEIIASDEVYDGEGAYCFPGMIDMHFHGCMGADVCDGTREALQTITEYEASIGVTAIAPATMTLPAEELFTILRSVANYKEEQEMCHRKEARILGIDMEGPFISPKKAGAQKIDYIRKADIHLYEAFQKEANGLVKIMGIAPEEGECKNFINAVSKDCVVSISHSNADYESAKKAIEEGASHLTHAWNAMSSFLHRDPGIMGAVLEDALVTAELICDGVHVHPAVLKATFRILGVERIIIVSDSMRATGMEDGIYMLGGQEVVVKGNKATLKRNGSMAGSVTPLPDCVRFVVKNIGVPLEDAIAMATMNPAKRLGVDDRYGLMKEGYVADLVLWNQDLTLKEVFMG